MLNKSQRRLAKFPHDVYKAFDADGRFLYVGLSVDVFRRLQQHRREYAAWEPDAVRVEVAQYENRASAHFEEARCIREDSPAYNVTRERPFSSTYTDTIVDSFTLERHCPQCTKWVMR
ncbi:hypothetical protein [Rathayibacter sp. VKM Ac-2630]|uniref:hypothetical protein n=1 Tax=Rathayibacter sp. VKM Ac-2630 TaxID=1938617 RepID=UPI000982063F|nr:hypothetical protein [Rathayibacter sp. VKM Ac-2630]OOB91210.1 hypothetical protein B0T42_07380 [Rathayibacter sp. VKM Ac-2630]